jgi:hypothetical protein
MPSPNKTQLNLSVDAELKERFRDLCDDSDLSMAKAFESFMRKELTQDKAQSLSTFDSWIKHSARYAPAKLHGEAVFVHDTLDLAKRIAESLFGDVSPLVVFGIYDRLINRINQ